MLNVQEPYVEGDNPAGPATQRAFTRGKICIEPILAIPLCIHDKGSGFGALIFHKS